MSDDVSSPIPVVPTVAPSTSIAPPSRVVVVDFDISIGNMTVLILKTIPALFLAAVVLSCIGGAIIKFVSGFTGHQ